MPAGDRLDRHPGIAQRLHRRVHLVDFRALEGHLAAGDRRRAGIGTSLDAVGHDAVGRAVEAGDAVDGYVGAADALDLRAHGDEEMAQVDDLGLARGVVQR